VLRANFYRREREIERRSEATGRCVGPLPPAMGSVEDDTGMLRSGAGACWCGLVTRGVIWEQQHLRVLERKKSSSSRRVSSRRSAGTARDGQGSVGVLCG
jgi:hypothetical protein